MNDNDNIISLTGKGMDKSSEVIGLAKRMIWVTFTKEGMHCYPAAATDPKLATGDEYDVAAVAVAVAAVTRGEVDSHRWHAAKYGCRQAAAALIRCRGSSVNKL